MVKSVSGTIRNIRDLKRVNRPTVSKGKMYDKFFIYLPTELVKDARFPFRDGERLEVEIEGNTLIMRKGGGSSG